MTDISRVERIFDEHIRSNPSIITDDDLALARMVCFISCLAMEKELVEEERQEILEKIARIADILLPSRESDSLDDPPPRTATEAHQRGVEIRGLPATEGWVGNRPAILPHLSNSGAAASQSSARGAPNSKPGESGSGWDLTTVREFVSSCERFIKNRWPLSKK